MDDLDHRLLALLRSDARRSVASLAAELDASRATIRARLDRMLRSGVVSGFTVVVRDPSQRNHVRAIALIAVEGKGVEKVMRRLHGFPEVRRLHSTNGRWDIVAELVADTLAAFDRLLHRIREIDGITATETSILLSSPKDLP
ncbi:MAG: Lrp/AsnC family transcriptional regulator [Hyphomicrobium sp.]|jgi:DNA-binding Lrp family transcriptional regulator